MAQVGLPLEREVRVALPRIFGERRVRRRRGAGAALWRALEPVFRRLARQTGAAGGATRHAPLAHEGG